MTKTIFCIDIPVTPRLVAAAEPVKPADQSYAEFFLDAFDYALNLKNLPALNRADCTAADKPATASPAPALPGVDVLASMVFNGDARFDIALLFSRQSETAPVHVLGAQIENYCRHLQCNPSRPAVQADAPQLTA